MIAIYSRKSKFTGKGESIDNQVQLCKEYAIKYLDAKEESFSVYEDEGWSGKNIKRPDFQRMLKDVKNKKIEILICYRLDRVSRNVSDFSTLINDLNKYDVNFVSIREQFDTTTPMGRAMMYIASVFSQLERETIAERIRDNMMELAKTGRWLGGIVPTGFSSKAVSKIDTDGKERKMFKLSPIEEEINLINLIYTKFSELKSLNKVESYLIINKINTKNGIDFTRLSIKFILQNPIYAVADKNIYNYLIENNYDVYSQENEFNGINGLIGYNKTNQDKDKKTNRTRDVKEWVISVGKHIGVIPSDIWIETQNLLKQNKSKSFRKVKSSQSLLSGILRCANCGSVMRPKATRLNKKSNELIFYYVCELNEKSKKQRCDMTRINGNKLDKSVVQELKKFSKENSPLYDDMNFKKALIASNKKIIKEDTITINKKIVKINSSVKNIVSSIENGQPENVLKILYARIAELEKEKEELNKNIENMETTNEITDFNEMNMQIASKNLSDLSSDTWDTMDVTNKRVMIKSIIEKISWDGKNIEIVLFGAKTIEVNKDIFLSKFTDEIVPECMNSK